MEGSTAAASSSGGGAAWRRKKQQHKASGGRQAGEREDHRGDAQKVRPTRREAAATLLLVSLPHASRMAARRMSLDDEEGTAAAVHAEDMCFGNEDACARRKVMIISPVRGLLHCGARRCDEAGKRYTGPVQSSSLSFDFLGVVVRSSARLRSGRGLHHHGRREQRFLFFKTSQTKNKTSTQWTDDDNNNGAPPPNCLTTEIER